ncbi:Heat shock cognate protein [Echinococcus granulosus]|uniref:Heat shock cognate protein n=1 Tax=Echinococcus granulosus TaxID=6210 RepID=W6UBC8_ECHGR|nr:Heat shock cognate protein [Echinococcus granulosus]EUB57856.1 Heat shock cognate protein [Echinococcus granulosus]
MMNDAETFKQADEKEKSRMEARIKLENCIFSIKLKIEGEEMKQKTSRESTEDILMMCNKNVWEKETHEDGSKREDMKEVADRMCGKYSPLLYLHRWNGSNAYAQNLRRQLALSFAFSPSLSFSFSLILLPLTTPPSHLHCK